MFGVVTNYLRPFFGNKISSRIECEGWCNNDCGLGLFWWQVEVQLRTADTDAAEGGFHPDYFDYPPSLLAAAATKWKCFQNYKNSALAGRRKNMFWPIRGGEGCLINMIEGDPCQCWSAIKLQDYKTFSGLNNGGGTEAQRKNLRKINLSTKTQFRAFRLLSFNWTTDTFLFAFFAPVL